MEVAAHARAGAPDLKLRGAIAIAPGGYRYADIARYALDHPHPTNDVAASFLSAYLELAVPVVGLGAATAISA